MEEQEKKASTRRIRSKEERMEEVDRQIAALQQKKIRIAQGGGRFSMGTPEDRAAFLRFVGTVGKNLQVNYAALAGFLHQLQSTDAEVQTLTFPGQSDTDGRNALAELGTKILAENLPRKRKSKEETSAPAGEATTPAQPAAPAPSGGLDDPLL